MVSPRSYISSLWDSKFLLSNAHSVWHLMVERVNYDRRHARQRGDLRISALVLILPSLPPEALKITQDSTFLSWKWSGTDWLNPKSFSIFEIFDSHYTRWSALLKIIQHWAWSNLHGLGAQLSHLVKEEAKAPID
jgi:hypothetical protein